MATIESTRQATPATGADSYEHVGRQAWIMLWAAFVVFLIIVIGTPLAVNWFIHNATVMRLASVEAIRGTTLVIDPGSSETVAVVDTLGLREGSLIRTDETARANVAVYAGAEGLESLATVQLRNNSELLLERARTARFRNSDLPDRVEMRLNLGRARVTGNTVSDRPLEVVVKTLHGAVYLREGDDAAIAVSNESTEVIARGGQVRVEAAGVAVNLSDGLRTTIRLGGPPSAPQEGAIDLVQNGDFAQPLESAWEVQALVDAGDPSIVSHGTVSIIDSGDRRAAYFVREGEEGIHTETAIVQQINADVLDFDSLILRMDVLLLSQSLPGGGQQSSEFPLMARIDFVDVDGNPRFWTWGFYAVDPVANWPIRDGEKIPNFVWYDYESPDFLKSPTFPRPQRVTSIRIYASGHNYRSQASGVGLLAQ